MMQVSDANLLDRFRASRDREALDLLIRRYIDLVYSAAIRHVRDPHLAEDITQAVFIVLVRNARSIRSNAILPAWLFTVTRHAASNALRVRNRQRFHEMRKMQETSEHNAAVDETHLIELREQLDRAIARLPNIERSSVLLHFFSNQTHKEVGETLGLSEEAARKRVSRGVEKLRAMLGDRPLDSRALACEAAPSALLASTVNIALLANTIAPSSSAATMIAQGVSRMIAMTKIKVAAALAAGVVLTGGVAFPIVTHALRPSVTAIVTTMIAPPPAPGPAPTTAPATEPTIDLKDFTVKLDDRTTIAFIGVSKYPPDNDSWWALNGEAIDAPEIPLNHGHIVMQPPPENAIAIRITRPNGTILRATVPGATGCAVMQINDGDNHYLACAFSSVGNNDKARLEVGVSAGGWNTVLTNDKPTEEAQADVPELGAVVMQPIEASDEGCQVTVVHPAANPPTQLVVVDVDGKEIQTSNVNVRSDGASQTTTCTFDVQPERVKKVLYQDRPFSKHIDVSDISLEKGTITHPQIKVRDASK